MFLFPSLENQLVTTKSPSTLLMVEDSKGGSSERPLLKYESNPWRPKSRSPEDVPFQDWRLTGLEQLPKAVGGFYEFISIRIKNICAYIHIFIYVQYMFFPPKRDA